MAVQWSGLCTFTAESPGSIPDWGTKTLQAANKISKLTACMCIHDQSLSPVRLFANPCTVAHQALRSMEFSRQQYWRQLPFPTPGDLPNPGIEPLSPALAGGFFTAVSPGKPKLTADYVSTIISQYSSVMCHQNELDHCHLPCTTHYMETCTSLCEERRMRPLLSRSQRSHKEDVNN